MHHPTLTDPRVGALVAAHKDFLAFVERRVGSRALAEDILQDAFVKSLDKVATVRERESAVAWFYRVLRNAITDHGRGATSEARGVERLAHEAAADGEALAPDERDLLCGCVTRLAGGLKPEYADALQRIDVDGLAVKDYAAAADITANNAAVRVFRARQALRNEVARACGTCAEHGCLDCTCRASGA